MDTIVTIIGVVFVFMTIVYFLKPDVTKSLMEFFKQGRRIYFVALIRLALAIVFLVAARQCRYFWVIFAFGVLFIISGLLIFILGLEKVKSYISWWQKQPAMFLRVIALIGLAIGALIIYSA
ncbi:MAG: hypothetical protein PHQ35_00555 [Phycisphaerae bacterium]|nr:hypothetical protein [Phycisphaerae bacterium]MDD5381441.1 hypothetical protein [Phycisphaerae bacterium]